MKEAAGTGGEATFDEQLANSNLAAARVASVLAGVTLIAGVSLDYVTHRDQLVQFLAIRAVGSVLSLVVLPLTFVPAMRKRPALAAAVLFLLCEATVLALIRRIEGYASPYYAGLNSTIFAACLLFTWRWKNTAILCGLTVALWLVPGGDTPATFDLGSFSNNLYFLLLTSGLAVATSALRYRAAEREFAARSALSKASTELAVTLEQLQKLDRFKSEFFANVTHELKTPLTMILAPLELMLQGEMGALSEPQRASLQSMLRNGMKLLKLIGDLLDLSKLDESHLRLRVAEHDMVAYLRDLVTQVQALAQRKSIELTFDTNVAASAVYCDIERLERVFVNLLSNAAKFTPPGGKIRVSLADRGERVELAVEDSGIGFPSAMAQRIFERFFQVDMAGTRKFGGTGIGLALARELVVLHGGKIRAASAPGEGATFTVELRKGRDHFDPRAIDRRERAEDRVAGNRAADRGVGEWEVEAKSQFRFIDIDEATNQRIVDRDPDEGDRSESVLVVEDTPDVIRVIHLALRGYFRVLAAPGGQKGFEMATKHLPSLVITDLMMPEVDGLELTRRLRADARTRHVPVIMLTARGDVEDRVGGLEAGVNAYLTKPFSAKELLSTARGLVRIQETAADLLLTHSMDSLQTVAGGLAHEINNPLNYVRNALDLIHKDARRLLPPAGEGNGAAPMPERMKKMFEVAESGLARIGATVALMQRYSREGYTRAVQPVDVFESARDVASMLGAGGANPPVEVSFSGEGRLECVPEEMNQVLTNLVQNALDAIPRDGTGWVKVTGKADAEALVLSVADNGAGIEPEVRDKIFRPFFTTKDVGVGMGLGLTIVHRVVTSLDGTVSVKSRPGSGTEFVITIPRRMEARGG